MLGKERTGTHYQLSSGYWVVFMAVESSGVEIAASDSCLAWAGSVVLTVSLLCTNCDLRNFGMC